MTGRKKRLYRTKRLKRREKEKRQAQQRRAEDVFYGMGGVEQDDRGWGDLIEPPAMPEPWPERTQHYGAGSETPPGCCWWCKHTRHKHQRVAVVVSRRYRRGHCRETGCRCPVFTSPPRR